MIHRSLDIPVPEYTYLQNFGRFRAQVAHEIATAAAEHCWERICLFGAANTSKALSQILGDRICQRITSENLNSLDVEGWDAIVIATAPLHYPLILKRLGEIAGSFAGEVVTVFETTDANGVRLILETQPRSGTGYTIRNLQACLDLGYASVFDERSTDRMKRSADGRFRFRPSRNGSKYMVKSHFMQPLHYPEYRYVKTMFQISFLFDSYYSWAKILSPSPVPDGYRLEHTSREWNILCSYLPLNAKWLEYIRDKFQVRYEDYYFCFDKTIRRISDFLGSGEWNSFEKPQPNPSRMYWTDTYHPFFDEEVFNTLKQAFLPCIRCYWPEKICSLKYR
ncbi:MAG: hypothetical protein JW896_11745 [Deltaproteobacteria bacterium]|nr:hypothetical protein [Deltaproteobacteria bacterium]